MNQATLIGNLTRDPELRYTPSGVPVCNFSVATNEGFGEKSRVEYHNVIVWGSEKKENGGTAGACANFLKKGSKVAVVGKIQTRKYTASDGVERRTTEIVVNTFDGKVEFLSGTKTREEAGVGASQQQSSEAAAASDVDPDDIPF